jgi:hypothetical protein
VPGVVVDSEDRTTWSKKRSRKERAEEAELRREGVMGSIVPLCVDGEGGGGDGTRSKYGFMAR